MRSLLRVAWTLALVFAGAACRTASRWPTPAEREAFGDVGVVALDDGVRDVPRPVTGWARGLGTGTTRGLVLVPGLAGAGAVGVLMVGVAWPPAIAAGAVVGAAVGVVLLPVAAVRGAFTAASEEEVVAAEPAVHAALAEPGLADAFAAAFRAESASLHTRPLVDADRAQTVVELRIVRVFTQAHKSAFSLDPQLAIAAETHARVIRREDGTVLWEWTQVTPRPTDTTPAHRFTEWGANDAAPLRAELRRVIAELGRVHAANVFGGPRVLPRP